MPKPRVIYEHQGRRVVTEFTDRRLGRAFGDVWRWLAPWDRQFLLDRVALPGTGGTLLATDALRAPWDGWGTLNPGPGLTIVWLNQPMLDPLRLAVARYVVAHELGHLWRCAARTVAGPDLTAANMAFMAREILCRPVSPGDYAPEEMPEEWWCDAFAAALGFEKPPLPDRPRMAKFRVRSPGKFRLVKE